MLPILPITVIGSFPKPSYITLPDWFRDHHNISNPSLPFYQFSSNPPPNLNDILNKGTQEVIEKQINLGIDIPTDGEIRRENYIYYFCRHLNGIDFSVLTPTIARSGWKAQLPTIVGPITAQEDNFIVRDYLFAQSVSSKSIKYTLPGPMTILDSTVYSFYHNNETLGRDLAKTINSHVLALVKTGCKHIQIDEPLFARKPDEALSYGIKNLELCFENVGNSIIARYVHICCGYPHHLDEPNYPKADPNAYLKIAAALDNSILDVISIEDAHRRNSLELFKLFRKTNIIVGVIDVAISRIDSIKEIENHLLSILYVLPPNRMIIAPDCGLGFLPLPILNAKLTNMIAAVHNLRTIFK